MIKNFLCYSTMTRTTQRTLRVLLPLVALLAAAWFFLRPGGHDRAGAAAARTEIDLYACGMHPQVIQDKPGNCPICGMKLTPIRTQPVERGERGERKIKFYKSTMTPGETSPAPRKDSMGMDMVPVYEDGSGTGESQVIAID